MTAKVKLVLSLISVFLLSAGWIGLSGIGLLVGIVPILMISASYGKGRKPFWHTFRWIALILGLWSIITTGWLVHIRGIVGVYLPALVTALIIVFVGAAFMAYHYVSKRAPKALAYTLLIALWIAWEHFYTMGQISFAWLTLGNGFANDIKLVQWYDTTGVFGGSLWVLLSNILVFEAIRSRRAVKWIAPAIVILVPMVISLVKYYSYEEKGEKVKVTVVQPNIEAYEEKYYMPQERQIEIMLDEARKAPEDVDFIVFPETAIHKQIWENSIQNNPLLNEFRTFIDDEYPQAQIILGVSSNYQYGPGEKPSETARRPKHFDIWYDAYNTALALAAGGRTQIRHKSILVVGVETIPYYNVLKHLEWLSVNLGGTTGQLGIDSRAIVFSNPQGIKSAAPVCWEALFGYYCGEFARNGAQVFFVISNDGWWGDSRGHRQLFQYSRLRAVETRRSIGRSANTGTSGFVNQRGDVLQKVGWNIRTALTDELTLNDHVTFYAKYGDYIARIAYYVAALCILYYIGYYFKRRNKLVE